MRNNTAPEPASAPAATTAARDDATEAARRPGRSAASPADLFGLAAASDPQISPDGRHIAYVRRRANDIMSDRAVSTIWLIDTQTGAEVPSRDARRRCFFATLVARRQAARLCLDRGRQRPTLGALDGRG